MFRRVKLEGLPSTFVGNYLIVGADEAMLRSAVSATIAGGGLSVRWLLIIIAGLLGAVTALSVTQRSTGSSATGRAGAPVPTESEPEDGARGRAGEPVDWAERKSTTAGATPAPWAHGPAQRKGRASQRPPAHPHDTDSEGDLPREPGPGEDTAPANEDGERRS